MYLVDTNIWLERLLGQAKSDEVGQFLDQIPSNQLLITDFAFHSLCVILTRLKRKSTLLDFVQDIFVDGAVTLVSIKPE
jgi:predicted nucleic acid-binding protein